MLFIVTFYLNYLIIVVYYFADIDTYDREVPPKIDETNIWEWICMFSSTMVVKMVCFVTIMFEFI